MGRINPAKFFLVMIPWVFFLAWATSWLKKEFAIDADSSVGVLLSMAVLGFGIFGAVAVVVSLVNRGKLRWLLRQ